jgi:hypothetical protein
MDLLGISDLTCLSKDGRALASSLLIIIVAIVSIAVALSGDSVWGVASDLYRLSGEIVVR